MADYDDDDPYGDEGQGYAYDDYDDHDDNAVAQSEIDDNKGEDASAVAHDASPGDRLDAITRVLIEARSQLRAHILGEAEHYSLEPHLLKALRLVLEGAKPWALEELVGKCQTPFDRALVAPDAYMIECEAQDFAFHHLVGLWGSIALARERGAVRPVDEDAELAIALSRAERVRHWPERARAEEAELARAKVTKAEAGARHEKSKDKNIKKKERKAAMRAAASESESKTKASAGTVNDDAVAAGPKGESETGIDSTVNMLIGAVIGGTSSKIVTMTSNVQIKASAASEGPAAAGGAGGGGGPAMPAVATVAHANESKTKASAGTVNDDAVAAGPKGESETGIDSTVNMLIGAVIGGTSSKIVTMTSNVQIKASAASEGPAAAGGAGGGGGMTSELVFTVPGHDKSLFKPKTEATKASHAAKRSH